jgi:chromosome transmission fidelity protein 18
VFGQEKPTRKPRPSVEPARIGKEATAPGKWKSHEQVLEEMLEAELDPNRRPRQKVSPTQPCVDTSEPEVWLCGQLMLL